MRMGIDSALLGMGVASVHDLTSLPSSLMQRGWRPAQGPSCSFPSARWNSTVHRSVLAAWAEYGYCASHSRPFWGLRLHLV